MKILFVAAHSPFGPQYGAQKRSLQIFRALERIGEVSITLVQFRQVPIDELMLLKSACRVVDCVSIESAPIQTLQQRLRREFSARYLNTDGFSVSAAAKERLVRAIDAHDVVWIHTIRIANAFGLWRWPKSVVDIDDVPSAYWRTESRNCTSLLQKARKMRFSVQWRRRERLLWERFSILGVCSAKDKQYLGNEPRIHVIPNGFEAPDVRAVAPDARRPRLGMIGSFSFRPNIDGIQWFLHEVWPKVIERVPEAELRLVGNTSGGPDFARYQQVTALGYVDEPAAEIRSWSGMIVPIRIGGGTRVKIAEGFARGCPVIATSLGAFGYAVENGRELLLADDAEAFADGCVRLLKDASLRQRLATAAGDYFDQHLSWDAVAPLVHKAVEDALRCQMAH